MARSFEPLERQRLSDDMLSPRLCHFLAAVALLGLSGCSKSCGTAPIECNSGKADCNHVARDGCEADLKTAPENCGRCGHRCGARHCIEGECSIEPEVVGKGCATSRRSSGLSVAGEWIFWRYNDVLIAAKTSDWKEVVVDVGVDIAFSADRRGVVWSTGSVSTSETSTERLRPARVLSQDGRASAVVVDDGRAYWSSSSGLMAVERNGGTARKLTTWPSGSFGPLAIDADYIYFSREGFIARVHKHGGSPAVVTPATVTATMDVDDERVFWVDRNELKTVLKTGGVVTDIVSFGIDSGVAVPDGVFVYYQVGQTVWRVRKVGGDPEFLARDLDIYQAGAIAVDREYVYWYGGCVAGSGRIKRIPKPLTVTP